MKNLYFPIKLTLNGQIYSLIPGGRAPKMRFKIGDKFKIAKDIWEIIAAFREKTSPNEWYYILEDSPDNVPDHVKRVDQLCATIAAVDPKYHRQEPPERIIYDLFHSTMDGSDYFRHIPIKGTTRLLRKSKNLMAATKV